MSAEGTIRATQETKANKVVTERKNLNDRFFTERKK